MLFYFLSIVVTSVVLAEVLASSSDPGFESFVEGTPMPVPMSDMTATLFEDTGRIYIIGGCIKNQDCPPNGPCYCPEITNDCHYLSLSDEKWHSCPSAPTKRYRHMAARVGDYVYVSGGRDLNDSLITSVERFNTITNVWDTFPYTWAGASSDAVAFSLGTKYFIAGGYDASYNLLSNMTMIDTASGLFYHKAHMNVGRGDVGGAEYGGLFYVLGGWDAATSFCTALDTVEAYDPAADTWTVKPHMAHKRGDLAVGVLGGSIFSIAGETKDSSCNFSVPVRDVGRYDIKDQTWVIEQSIPLDLFRFIGVSLNRTGTADDVIYLFGGQSSYDSGIGGYKLKDSTIKYTPESLRKKSKKKLSDGGIAGIVIAVIVVLFVLLVAALSYIGYLRRAYYTAEDVRLAEDTGEIENSYAPASGSAAGSATLKSRPNNNGGRHLENNDYDDEDIERSL